MRSKRASQGKTLKVYVKVHPTGQRYGNRFVIAVCDKELIGKTLKEGKLQVHISARFYQGELRSDNEVIALLKDATNANIMGKHAVDLAAQAGMIDKKNVRKIKGIPHAQATAF